MPPDHPFQADGPAPAVVLVVGEFADAALGRLTTDLAATGQSWPPTTVLARGPHTAATIRDRILEVLDARHGDAIDRSRPELLIVAAAADVGADLAPMLDAGQQTRAALLRANIDCRIGLFLFTEPLPERHDGTLAAQAAVQIARRSDVPDFVLAMHTFDHRHRAIGSRRDAEALMAETLRLWFDPARHDVRSRLHLQFRMAPLASRWFALGIRRLLLTPPGLGEAMVAGALEAIAPLLSANCGRAAALHLTSKDLQDPQLTPRLLRDLDEHWRRGVSLAALHGECDDYLVQIDVFLARERAAQAAATTRLQLQALRPPPPVAPRLAARGWRRVWNWLCACWHRLGAALAWLFGRRHPLVRPPAVERRPAPADQSPALVALAAQVAAIEAALASLTDPQRPVLAPPSPWVEHACATLPARVSADAQRELQRRLAATPLAELLPRGALRAQVLAFCRDHLGRLADRPSMDEATARIDPLLHTVAAPWPETAASSETFVIAPPGVDVGRPGVTAGVGRADELLVLELQRGLRFEDGSAAASPQDNVA